MPLWVAMTTTARPARNSAVRYSGHGRAGCRRRTRSAPQRYRPAATTTKPVTTGANCHRLATSARLNGGSASLPISLRLLGPGQAPGLSACLVAWLEVGQLPGAAECGCVGSVDP